VVATPAPEQIFAPLDAAPEEATEPAPVNLPTGRFTHAVSATAGATVLDPLPLSLAITNTALTGVITAQVTMLDQSLAEKLSPVGLAFTLQLDQGQATAAEALQPELTLDYSQLALPYGGSFSERLRLYRVSNCAVLTSTVTITAETSAAATEPALECGQWQALPGQNDVANRRLIVSLVDPLPATTITATTPLSHTTPLSDVTPSPAPNVAPTPQAGPDPQGPYRYYLPVVLGGHGDASQPSPPPPGNSDDGPYYVVAAGVSGPQGNYAATPLSNVGNYQVGLFSGAGEAGYEIPLPPAAAGPAPSVNLSYSSAMVDGMTNSKNNQPGWVGLGWELGSGSIVRHLKGCNTAQAPGDLCLSGDNFSITLNGASARLVKQSGNLYYLQDDSRWKVERFTNGPTGHPDAQQEYWWVTTPDGTRYRFGGEIEPETSLDQNSAFYVTVYDYTTICGGYAYSLCDKVWQWNLDRVEDPNGNVISFFYEQEENYYKGRDDSRPELRRKYVRAGALSRIEYTKKAGQSVQPHARVLFNTELRCLDPASSGNCAWPASFPDTPGDLACEYSGTCSQNSPSFWSQRKLDSIQAQIYDQAGSVWMTVGLYDLSQSFPTPPVDGQGDASERKLWLESITQRPGGSFSFTAFSQLEAENYSSMAGVSTESALDVGRGRNVTGTDNNDYLLFRKVDFGSGAGTLLARVATASTGGTIEFRLDSASGTKVAEIAVTSTGGAQSWTTKSATVTGGSGIHDLYVVFKGAVAGISNLNWFRFVPSSGLPGQPPVQYGYSMLANRRTYDVLGVSPMTMPRLNQITTELGGVVNLTYNQSHPCPATLPNYIRPPYDCFVAWDSGDPGISTDDGWMFWQKWKVTQLQKSDSFSGNPSESYTYSYSTPAWHYSDDPTLPDVNSCSTCPTRHWNDFRGHQTVTVTDASGAKSEYRFYQGMNGDRLNTSGGSFAANITLSDSSSRADENWLRGKPVEERRLKSNNSALSRSLTWYTWTLNAGSGLSGAYFVGVQKSEATAYGTTPKTSRVEYVYDSYGNVTREIQHGDTALTGDDRNLERSYVYNTSAYIVDRPQWEKLWTGTGSGSSGAEKGYVAYGYDSLAIGTAPSKGNPTLLRAYHRVTPSAAYYDTTTGYDSRGRPTTVTNPNNRTTTTAYHSFYGYVQSVTNALTHVATYVYDPGWGVVVSVTDPNNKTTTSEIDAYGRLKKVGLPTESTGGPASYEFNYAPSQRPAYVQSRQLFKAASSAYLESWSYVDGFGREMQSQRASLTNGYRVVSSSAYDNLGQRAYASIPYEISGSAGSGYVAPTWTSLSSYRRYAYDELGRPVRDELWYLNSRKWCSEETYDGWLRSHKNENLRQSDYTVDGFGRLVQVKEYNSGGATYTTQYAYDYQDNLTQATDAANNVTTMSYNLLGWKTAMTDPDMGSWSYVYDGAGNLLEQTDGRGWKIVLEYDALNRLVKKRKDNSAGPLIAEFFYDSAGQKGLLGNSKAYSNEGDIYVYYENYDGRNRLTQQQWAIPGTGGGLFRLGWSYDEADHVTAVKYPHDTSLIGLLGETVSRSYNAVGQLDQVVSQSDNTPYVAGTLYTPDGLAYWQRYDQGANGAERNFGYYAADRRLATLNAGNGGSTTNRQSAAYFYDAVGNISRIKDYINSTQQQVLPV
jgi:YD repeat-containing protein